MEHSDSLIVRKEEPSGAVTTYSYIRSADRNLDMLLRDETYSLDGSTFYVNRHFYDWLGRLVET